MPAHDDFAGLTGLNHRYEEVRSGCGQAPYHAVTTPFIGWAYAMIKERVWGNTPDFQALRRSGSHLPDQPFLLRQRWRGLDSKLTSWNETRENSTDNGQVCVLYRYNSRESPFGWYTQPSDGESPGSWLTLKQRAMERARSNQFNLPVFLAEAGKTTQLVSRTALTMVEWLRRLRRGDVGWVLDQVNIATGGRSSGGVRRRFNADFGRDASRAVANAWLEIQYGWKPLMHDVRNAVNLCMDLSEKEASTEGCIRTSKEFKATTESSHTIEVSPFHEATRIRTVNESRRLVWRFAMDPANLPARFGLVNPLEVAWELVPFSFVADWFLPIGSYLSSLDTSLRFTHRGGTYGIRRETSDNWVNPRSTEYQNVTGSATHRFVLVSREPMSDPPRPTLADFHLTVSLGTNQMLSALALLRQALPR